MPEKGFSPPGRDSLLRTGIHLAPQACGRVRVVAAVGVRSCRWWSTEELVRKQVQRLLTVSGPNAVYEFNGSELYVRARVTSISGQFAWTQPYFPPETISFVPLLSPSR